jgi:muconolactone delta-isomerase
MQYLVTGDCVEGGPLLPPAQLVDIIRQLVVPSHDALTELKAQGKLLAGGYSVGERAGAFIFDVDSNAELDALLQRLPFWGLIKFRVTPLEDVEGRRERDRQQADEIEQTLQR